MAHQPKDVTVRVQALDGRWEALGIDRQRGVWAENVQLGSDGWGSSRATFDLKRDPRAAWPDLTAFTPVEIEVGGTVVWSGRISETPTRDGADRAINAQAEGWQFHLDDDLYERVYAHTRLSDYKDARSYATAMLGNAGGGLGADGQVSVDGAIVLGWPAGRQMVQYTKVGVELDLGPSSAARRIVVEWEHSNNEGNARILVRGSSEELGRALVTTDYEDIVGLPALTGGTTGTASGTFTPARRFVTVMLQSDVTFTPAADFWAKIKAVRVFTDTAYESGGQSALEAPVVINDALDRATVLLSADRSQIDPDGTVTFAIPELAPGEPRTPREMIQAVNAFHDYLASVDPDRRMVFRPKPSAATLEVGGWGGMEFEDASANSGAEIYNNAIVQGQTPGGEPVRLERTQGERPDGVFLRISNPAPTNPSMDTDTAGWSSTNSGEARYTGGYDTAPASLRWDWPSGAGDVLTGTFTGTFTAGVLYRLTFSGRGGSFVKAEIAFGDIGAGDAVVIPKTEGGVYNFGPTWATHSVLWLPRADSSSVTVEFRKPEEASNPNGVLYVDSLVLDIAQPTLVDRRGFRRSMALPIAAKLPSDGAAARHIADVWLADHRTTPFKGTVRLTGASSVREIATGAAVPLELLLLRTGELLRFSDRDDPDSGSHGRDGRIAAVTYSPATDEATVTIDNSRASFEALVGRLAVVTGGR